MLAMRFRLNITNTFCPTVTPEPCSGHGTCGANNTCTCTAPFAGADCSINTLVPPSITSVPLSSCDVRGILACPQSTIVVSGSGFLNSPNLACRYNNTVLPALYMGNHEVMCQFPKFRLAGFSENLMLSVSNDASLWSNNLTITYYDSNCVICPAADTCSPNNNSCIIGGACYTNGQVYLSNPCLSCNRAVSSSSWSYSYAHYVCGPSFSFNYYSFQIVGQVSAGYVLGTVHAGNNYVAGDPTNVISYAVNSSLPVAFPFTISSAGVITTTTSIDAATVDITRFPTTFLVFARDSHGYYATATVAVTLVSQSTAPRFTSSSFDATVAENVAVGTTVVTVSATLGSSPGPLVYDWVVADGHFSLNSATGVVIKRETRPAHVVGITV